MFVEWGRVKHSNFLTSPEVYTLVRAALWLGVLGGALWFLTRIQVTLTIFCLAWLIAYMTRPVVRLFEGKRLGPIASCPRGMAVGAIYFCLLAGLVVIASLAFPAVTGQFNRLLALQHTLYNPQELAEAIQAHGEKLVHMVPEKYREDLMLKLQSSLGSVTAYVGHAVTSSLTLLANFFGQLAAGAAIFLSATLISIYLLFSWESLHESVLSACPRRYRNDFVKLLVTLNRIFGGYLRATIICTSVNALATLLALTLFAWMTGRACPYAYIISLVCLLTYPIPLFGVLSATISGVILGFLPESDITTGLMVAAVAFTVNLIIDRTLQPKLMGDAIGVSPMFVIFAAAAGGEFLGGVWGMLLGIPLAAMGKAVFTWFHDLFLVDHSAPTEATHEKTPPAPGGVLESDPLPAQGVE